MDHVTKGAIEDAQLTGDPLYLTAPDLYRLLMWVEEQFGVRIPNEAVYGNGFHTIREAAGTALLCLKKQGGHVNEANPRL